MKNTVRILLAALAAALICTLISCGGEQPVVTNTPTPEESVSVVTFISLPSDTPTNDETESTSADLPTDIPSSGTEPTEPAVSTEPTEPTEPTVPTEPTEPVTEPTVPTEPTESTVPTKEPRFETLTGTCSSDTGTSLNVVFDYTVSETEEGKIKAAITVYLDHYSLFCSSRTNTNSITIGENVFSYSTESLHFDAGTGRHHTLLASAEYEYEKDALPASLKLSASWLFNGTYSQVPIGLITAETTVDLSV